MEVDKENGNTTLKTNTFQRKIGYRNLLNRVEDLQENEDVGIETVHKLHEIFQEANLLDQACHISDRVEHADETLLDAQVLSSASSVLVKCIEAVDVYTSPYDSTDFAKRLIDVYKNPEVENGETVDWYKLLDDARIIVPTLPQYSFIFGAFDPTIIPERKPPKMRKKNVQEQVQKKQLIVVQNSENEDGVIDDTVHFLSVTLTKEFEENNEPIDYYRFVVDSESFASTVENVFYSSFLVREGRAQLTIDDNGIPKLQPIRRKKLKQFRQDGGVNTQMIMSITMEEWEKFRTSEGIIQKHKKSMSPQKRKLT